MKEFTTVRTGLDGADVVLGGDARTFSPTVVELFGSLGLDYVWLDYEHAGPNPADAHHVERLCRAAAAADVEPVVRLPSGDPDLVTKLLDTGVRSIVVPQVKTAEEVRQVVEAAGFRIRRPTATVESVSSGPTSGAPNSTGSSSARTSRSLSGS